MKIASVKIEHVEAMRDKILDTIKYKKRYVEKVSLQIQWQERRLLQISAELQELKERDARKASLFLFVPTDTRCRVCLRKRSSGNAWQENLFIF